MSEAKEFKTSISVHTTAQTVAYCIALLGRVWSSDSVEKALRAIAAYYGYGIVKL